MKVTFNIRHLERNDLHLKGELPAVDLDLDTVDELIILKEPLFYDLQVERLSQSIYVHGKMSVALQCHCVRCLKPFRQVIEGEQWAWDLPLEGEDQVEIENDCVDLTPFIREDILLAFPQHPLCKTECRGLPKAPQKRSHQTSGATDSGEVSSAWAELNKLKF